MYSIRGELGVCIVADGNARSPLTASDVNDFCVRVSTFGSVAVKLSRFERSRTRSVRNSAKPDEAYKSEGGHRREIHAVVVLDLKDVRGEKISRG